MSTRQATIIQETACKTVYRVLDPEAKTTGVVIELGIITGGTPCLWFGQYTPWTQRFPELPKYSNDNWDKTTGRYKHQPLDPGCLKGPRVEECIPLGFLRFWEFYEQTLPKFELNMVRQRDLPMTLPMSSKRVRDAENCCMAHLEFSHGGCPFRLPYLTVSATTYCGSARGMPEKLQLFPTWWQQLHQLMAPIEQDLWDEIPEEVYRDICAHLRTVRKTVLKGT